MFACIVVRSKTPVPSLLGFGSVSLKCIVWCKKEWKGRTRQPKTIPLCESSVGEDVVVLCMGVFSFLFGDLGLLMFEEATLVGSATQLRISS